MIKNKKKIIALAMAMSVIVPSVVYAASTELSHGSAVANATLKATFTKHAQDYSKAKTQFDNSRDHSGYKVSAYIEARRKNLERTSTSLDTGYYWAEVNSAAYDVKSFGSSHAITEANNMNNRKDLRQLAEYR